MGDHGRFWGESCDFDDMRQDSFNQFRRIGYKYAPDFITRSYMQWSVVNFWMSDQQFSDSIAKIDAIREVYILLYSALHEEYTFWDNVQVGLGVKRKFTWLEYGVPKDILTEIMKCWLFGRDFCR
jgi:hypothetical protein